MDNYRKNVAAIVLDDENNILIFERSDRTAWGFPQGGIEPGENAETALARELSEELGIRAADFEVLVKAPELLRYDFPSDMTFRDWTFTGQEQQYFLVRLHPGVVLDFTRFPEEIEFLQYKAVSFDEFQRMDFGFKNEVYHEAMKFFEKEIAKTFDKLVRDKIPELIAAEGKAARFEMLDSISFTRKLNEKLIEEANEVIAAADKKSKTEELADLLEVVRAIAQNSGISLEEVEKVRLAKKEERGGFERRILLKSVN